MDSGDGQRLVACSSWREPLCENGILDEFRLENQLRGMQTEQKGFHFWKQRVRPKQFVRKKDF